MLLNSSATTVRSAIFVASLIASTHAFSAASHDIGHAHKLDIGEPAEILQADRTIEVSLRDIHFIPETISVNTGETVRFKLINDGEIVHEFNIGTPQMHKQHQQEMIVMFQHGMMTSKSVKTEKMISHNGREDSLAHDDPNSRLLDPRASTDLVWTFSKSTLLEFACNIPGHYELGMVGEFVFAEQAKNTSS